MESLSQERRAPTLVPLRTRVLADAFSAALAYHAAAVVLAAIELIRHPPNDLTHALYLNLPMQSLAVFSAAFLLRGGVVCLRRGRGGVREGIVGDLCVLVVVIAVFCGVSLPFDTSGAALFGIIVMAAVGIPLVIAASLLSVLAARRRWAARVLTLVVAVDVLALIVGSGLSLVAQP